MVRKEVALAWRQRHRPSINQKVHTRFQLLSEFLCRFFSVEGRMIVILPPGMSQFPDDSYYSAATSRLDLPRSFGAPRTGNRRMEVALLTRTSELKGIRK